MGKPEKKPEASLHALLNFMSSYRELEGGKRFFKNIDDFFSTQWEGSSFIVYSLVRARESDKALTRRLLWNRHKLNDFHEDVLQGKRSLLPSEGYYLLDLGEEKRQQFFGVLKTDAKIPAEFWQYWNTFLTSQLERVKELDNLKRFEYLIDIDSTTGLFNQQKLFRDIKYLVENHQMYRESFAVLFIDIDHFRLVNEKYGHLVGSETLVDLARLLKTILRDNDLIYRYGGDEFVVIVKGVTPDSILTVAERILNGIRDYPFDTKDMSFNGQSETFRISVSIGTSVYPEDVKRGEDILVLADKRMYQAKDSGRGRICGLPLV